MSEDYTEIIVKVKFKAQSPVEIVRTKYFLELNGVVLANGICSAKSIGSKSFELVIFIDNDKIKEWWISHIKKGEKSVGRVEIKPIFEIAGSQFEIPLVDQTITFETQIFGG